MTEIYKEHSGLRSGEDREATLIGIKYGYKCIYIQDIKALTRPPLSFKALIKQRIRWNLGYVETLKKEKKFYLLQSSKLAPVGVRFLLDFLWVCFICTLPLSLIGLGFYNIFDAIFALPLLYIICTIWCLLLILTNTKETVEIKSKLFLSVLMFPVYKFSVDYISWTGAISKFIKKK